MDEVLTLTRSARSARKQIVLRRRAAAAAVYAIAGVNAGVIVWLWIHGGNLHVPSTGELFTSIGRITGLLSAYLALLQVVLLARLPALERAVGFDRLSVWHRWNGHACIDLVVAHVIFTVWGYALMDKFTIGNEISTRLDVGVYPGSSGRRAFVRLGDGCRGRTLGYRGDLAGQEQRRAQADETGDAEHDHCERV